MKKKPESLPSNPKIQSVEPNHPDPSLILRAARIIAAGGLVIFPTRTLYGLGADAMNPVAVARVFSVKGRPAEKPVSVLVKSREDLPRLVEKIPKAAVRLMEAFWPGRITLVFQARPSVPPVLTAGTGKIGIRIPEHPVAVALAAALNTSLTGTSANLSGHVGASGVHQLPSGIIDRVDLVLDAGQLAGGIGSTVVDMTVDPPEVLREGTVSKEALFSVL